MPSLQAVTGGFGILVLGVEPARNGKKVRGY